MRINGVNLNSVSATGFDVHLVANLNAKPKRTDRSYLGQIALFRHDNMNRLGAHRGHRGGATPPASDTFDVTDALKAAGETDPTRMHVVIVPYSLSSAIDGGANIGKTAALKFESIEFLSRG